MKRLLSLLLCVVLSLSLAACGGGDDDNPSSGTPTPGDTVQAVDPDAPAHEQLMARAQNALLAAQQKTDLGLTLQGEYFYGQAQAELSSLRYAVDIILWLMGEGESLADVTAGAPYRDWDDIVAAGMGSPAPHYFEGLVLEIQGKTGESDLCYQRARANPTYEEMDFFYLRHMSVEELYNLRETVLEAENAVWMEYTPRTILCSTVRNGGEFSPTYHLALAAKAAETGNTVLAWNCARNALLCNPTQAELYASAVGYGLDAGDAQAVEILNEGLFVFPADGALNYLAGAVAASSGDNAAAEEFLTVAEQNGDENIKAACQALLEQIA